MVLVIRIILIIVINLSALFTKADMGGAVFYYDEDLTENDNSIVSPLVVEEVYDPLEPLNRAIFSFNQALDYIVLQPTAEVYLFVTPKPIRNNVENFYNNLTIPVSTVNRLLQGDFKEAGIDVMRFVTNIVLGFGGLMDVASEFETEYHSTDLGQTLGYYGFGEGPYIMLPIFGPTNYRDLLGRVGDYYTDPLSYTIKHKGQYAVLSAGKLVFLRAENKDFINNIRDNSLDAYSTLKSLYSQYRKNKINNIKNRKNNA